MLQPLKKIASQTAVYGISSIVGRFINYLLFPLHVSIFTKAEYGVVTELYAYVTFLAVLLTYGMETAFFKFSSQEEKQKSVTNTAFTALLFSTLVFVIIGYFTSGTLATALKYQNQTEYILYFVFIIAFDTLCAIPFAKLRQENKAMRFALIKLSNIGINVLLNLIVLLVIPKMVNGFVPNVGHVFIINMLASAGTLVMLMPQIKDIRIKINKQVLKEMLAFGVPLMIAGFAGMINETFDRVSMKFLLPQSSEVQEQLGLYGGCYKVAMLMTIFIQAYRFAAEPYFFNSVRDKDNLKLYARSTEIFVAICSIIFLCITLFLDLIFDIFLNQDYKEGMPLVPILMFANVLLGIYINASMWFKLSGRTRYGVYFSFFGATITILALLVLVPRIGIYGGAWATLICYASMALAVLWVGQKKYPIAYSFKKIAAYLGGSLAIYFLSLSWAHLQTFPRYGINTLIVLGAILVILKIEKKTLAKHAN